MKTPAVDVGHETQEWISGSLGRYNTWMYKQITEAVSDAALEVGLGTGSLSGFLTTRPHFYLTDAPAAYLEILEERFATHPQALVHAWDLETEAPVALEPRSSNSVICLNVSEHIEDDRKALKRLHSLLKPHGRMALLVPAYPALYNGFDKGGGHFRRYRKQELDRPLAETALKSQRRWHFNALGSLGWFVNGNLFRKTILPTGQMMLINWLPPLLNFKQRQTLPFGISTIAIAEALPDPEAS